MSGGSERQQARRCEANFSGERTAEAKSAIFETGYASFLVGELDRSSEDGSSVAIKAYELVVDPTDVRERRGLIVTFGLRAAAAGYRQPFGPVVLPGVGYSDTRAERPLTAVYFFLESPDPSSSADTTS